MTRFKHTNKIQALVKVTLLTIFLGVIGWSFLWAAPPTHAQTPNGITAPVPEDTIAGIVIITGTATHPTFLRYELAFYQEFNPNAGWIVFAEGNQQISDGVLAIWDTTVGRDFNAPVFPDGLYRLRLRVVRQDFNYDEFFITNLIISNDTPTPTPTITPTVTLDPAAVTLTPLANNNNPNPPPIDPNALPSLTPFPTPSPNATPSDGGAANPAATPIAQTDEDSQGIAGQISTIDTTPFIDAVFLGIRIVLYIFATLAAYLILRTLGRFLWRTLTIRLSNNPLPPADSTERRRRE